jgi:hypothetical protein
MHSTFSGSLESSAYLRESNSHEAVPFAIPVGTTDVSHEAPLLELGGGNTLNEIGEQSQKDQSDRIAAQTDILQERDRKMATVKTCGSSKSGEHMESQGKRKSINNLIEENYPKKAIVVKRMITNHHFHFNFIHAIIIVQITVTYTVRKCLFLCSRQHMGTGSRCS